MEADVLARLLREVLVTEREPLLDPVTFLIFLEG